MNKQVRKHKNGRVSNVPNSRLVKILAEVEKSLTSTKVPVKSRVASILAKHRLCVRTNWSVISTLHREIIRRGLEAHAPTFVRIMQKQPGKFPALDRQACTAIKLDGEVKFPTSEPGSTGRRQEVELCYVGEGRKIAAKADVSQLFSQNRTLKLSLSIEEVAAQSA